MEITDFLKRAMQRIPKRPVTSFQFDSWEASGKVTKESLGILPVSGLDAERFIGCVMDLDNYVGNIDYVEESRIIEDDRYPDPHQIHFYQRIKIPVLGALQQEVLITEIADLDGYHVAFWKLLDRETAALNVKQGMRSQYNDGAWIVMDGAVGYALSSAPYRDDVGFIKWKAMTKGADAGASGMIKGNIEAMVRWSKRG